MIEPVTKQNFIKKTRNVGKRMKLKFQTSLQLPRNRTTAGTQVGLGKLLEYQRVSQHLRIPKMSKDSLGNLTGKPHKNYLMTKVQNL